MATTNDVLQAVLIKVNRGSEKKVREWLTAKAAADPQKRHCTQTDQTDKNCKFLPDAQLKLKKEDREASYQKRTLPCEHMDVLAVSYLTGPFDFILVACVPDCAMEERFLVDCLRSWAIQEHIADTQTLTGLVYHAAIGGPRERD